jgi:hypothetical protein
MDEQAWAVLVLASAALFFLLCAATCDPGFLSAAAPQGKHALGDINHPAIWSGLCWDQVRAPHSLHAGSRA